MSKPVCYMGIYNEHDIRDMHTVVVRYVTDFKSNPDRVIPLYEHPPVPTTERRVEEQALQIAIVALNRLANLGNGDVRGNSIGNDIAAEAIDRIDALNAAPAKGEV